jgi:hypothetical protein
MVDTVIIQPGANADEPAISGVSWPAVAAGAIVSCALTPVVLAFGVGGLSVVSPWSGGVGASFKIGTGLYLVVIAMLSSSIGGYIAGRLRTRWVGVHSDESISATLPTASPPGQNGLEDTCRSNDGNEIQAFVLIRRNSILAEIRT